MQLSIIIPTFNEEKHLQQLLPHLQANSVGYLAEVIVVDCGSTDQTLSVANKHGAEVITTEKKGRSYQMNLAARLAKGKVLYFVHADTIPPFAYDKLIIDSVDKEIEAGCFTSIFDWNHPFLRFCNFFSRLPFWFCRGGGQTLFVTKNLFDALKGFKEDMTIMEEYEFIGRLKKASKFKIVKKNAVTSARDYRVNGPFRLQFIYACVFILYAAGASQEYMINFISKYIHKPSKSCS